MEKRKKDLISNLEDIENVKLHKDDKIKNNLDTIDKIEIEIINFEKEKGTIENEYSNGEDWDLYK